ncbi:MAG: diguanylate cyclase [Campylobacterota bacterium]|nr:diguanylate cyclase [Campylobacterota bacterium]
MTARILLLLLFISIPIFAKVILTDDLAKHNKFSINYFYDKNSNLTINDIENQDFPKSTSNSFTFGYITGTTWFKITIDNRSNIEDYVLYFNEAIWKTFDLYYKQNGIWKEELNGLDIPLSKRSIQDVKPAFNLNIDKNSTQVIYIKGQSIASQIGGFQILSNKEYFNPTKISSTHIYIAFSIIVIVIVLLNIYSYILTREQTYIYYIAYMIASILFASMHSGFYLIFGFDGWSEGLHVIWAFVILFLLLFSDKFLSLKTELPKIHKFFMFSVTVFLIFALLIYNNIAYSSMLFNIYSALFFTVLFFAVTKIFLQGSITAKYYLLALLIYTPLMGLMIATFNTFLEYSTFTRHSFLAGTLIEIIFFTLILTSKYRSISLEKLKIQEELVYEKSKNEDYLELEISKRTQMIEEQNKKLKASQEELQLLASTDSMTKLYNRRYFTEISKNILNISKRDEAELSILILDIDKFKNINDTFGHKTGDDVIIALAKMLQDSSRESDIISRWGGEEFVILLPNTKLKSAITLSEKIRKNVENLIIFTEDNKELKFTISIGVSAIDKENDTIINDAINRADKALYEAKESGRNRVCVS